MEDHDFDEIALFHHSDICRKAVVGRGITPFEFYQGASVAQRARIAATLKFDANQYLAANADVAAGPSDPLDHWLCHGRAEERRGNRKGWRAPLFDRRYYLRHYPEVRLLIRQGLYSSAEDHWILTGRDEYDRGDRSPFPDFDERRYLRERPDVVRAMELGSYTSGFDHWLSVGRYEERNARHYPHNPGRRSNKPGRLSEEKWAFWQDKGYVILEGAMSAERCQAANALLDRLWSGRAELGNEYSIDMFIERPTARRIPLRDAPEEARHVPYKISDLILTEPLMREIAFDEEIVAALRYVMQGEPVGINSLNLERGSTQRYHTDTLYMPGLYPDSMAAAWFAFEDVTAEAGPLLYYPGSHKIPLYTFSSGKPYQIDDEVPAYTEYMSQWVEKLSLVPEMFLPKQGDVLLWHERLYHAGGQIMDMKQTRKSLVVHYWRADLLPADQILAAGSGAYLDRPGVLS